MKKIIICAVTLMLLSACTNQGDVPENTANDQSVVTGDSGGESVTKGNVQDSNVSDTRNLLEEKTATPIEAKEGFVIGPDGKEYPLNQ